MTTREGRGENEQTRHLHYLQTVNKTKTKSDSTLLQSLREDGARSIQRSGAVHSGRNRRTGKEGEGRMKEKLQTEQNTCSVEKRIRGAFRAWRQKRTFETFYEHGQWWVIVPGTNPEDDYRDETYSVCDSNRGFVFEKV